MTQRFLLLFFTLLIKKKSKKVKYNEKFIKKKTFQKKEEAISPRKVSRNTEFVCQRSKVRLKLSLLVRLYNPVGDPVVVWGWDLLLGATEMSLAQLKSTQMGG